MTKEIAEDLPGRSVRRRYKFGWRWQLWGRYWYSIDHSSLGQAMWWSAASVTKVNPRDRCLQRNTFPGPGGPFEAIVRLRLEPLALVPQKCSKQGVRTSSR